MIDFTIEMPIERVPQDVFEDVTGWPAPLLVLYYSASSGGAGASR